MGKRYLIDLHTLSYNAMVADESWLMPIDDEEVNSWSKNSVYDVHDVMS